VLFERLAIDVLRIYDIKGVTKILRISWDEAWHIMEKAVSRCLKRKKKRIPKTIAVDEKSVGKGHDYITLVNDVDRAAVDEVRKEEHRELQRDADETLTGSKYLWLYSKENVPDRQKSRWRSMSGRKLKTDRAWAIKESYRELSGYTRLAWASRHFKAWFFWATHSRLEPVIEKARMFRKYLAQILTYFMHRITNAVSEGLNSKIQTIKKMACGYRNRQNFKVAIYFHCGALDLYPLTHKNVG
jgi:transposase